MNFDLKATTNFEKESCSVNMGLTALKMKSTHTDKTVGLHGFDSMYRVHMGRDNKGREDFIAQDS